MSKDIWPFFSTDFSPGRLFLEVGDGLKSVKGIEKLVNLFAQTFLTEITTDLVYPDIGTEVGSLIGRNISADVQIIKSIIRSSVDTAVELISSDQEEVPDDEFLESVTINSIDVEADTVSITVTVTSRAGTNREVVLPSLNA